MSNATTPDHIPAELEAGRVLIAEVLSPMKQAFVEKDEIIDLLGICLVARENLFLLGPPGTAKSALVQELGRRIDGRVFDYLLTRFTEPNEIFGPFDIRRLREGDLVTNTEGMLPDADFVFLDELLNANSAILNSLLLVLNERVFRRGRETRALPTLMVVGASNRLPEDEALGALFDRFLLRVRCENVGDDRLNEVLDAGWKLDIARNGQQAKVSLDSIRQLHGQLSAADFSAVRESYPDLVRRIREAGVAMSDRRAVKLQRLIAASALLCGRHAVNRTDLWPLRYIWDTEEQQSIIAAIVNDELEKADDAEKSVAHPRSRENASPDAEELARDLDALAERIAASDVTEDERGTFGDRLRLIASCCQWIPDAQQREFLETKVSKMWHSLQGADA